jgi:two-component system cell cycle response regulator
VIGHGVLTFRERVKLLASSREEALTDSLTGLGNRRRFVADLEAKLRDDEQVVLAVFDLDGFKTYNDSFGHAAGDALLSRVASQLAVTVAGYGHAYRLGGDEFCLLASPATARPGRLIERAAAALADAGEGFSVRCSFGAVLMPAEAPDVTGALRIADERMYRDKQRNRAGAEPKSIGSLVSSIDQRHSIVRHPAGVADLAEAVSRRLRLPEPELETLRQAAELHDVGKLAIPEEILNKPGPLTDDEWAFIRRHSLIGERILDATPTMGTAGKIVRSTHENWDGTGYPDGLASSEIPLAARIIAVCDSFEAMTTPRPYAEPISAQAAIRELVRCAGAQFDPEVVDAFAAVQADLIAELVA